MKLAAKLLGHVPNWEPVEAGWRVAPIKRHDTESDKDRLSNGISPRKLIGLSAVDAKLGTASPGITAPKTPRRLVEVDGRVLRAPKRDEEILTQRDRPVKVEIQDGRPIIQIEVATCIRVSRLGLEAGYINQRGHLSAVEYGRGISQQGKATLQEERISPDEPLNPGQVVSLAETVNPWDIGAVLIPPCSLRLGQLRVPVSREGAEVRFHRLLSIGVRIGRDGSLAGISPKAIMTECSAPDGARSACDSWAWCKFHISKANISGANAQPQKERLRRDNGGGAAVARGGRFAGLVGAPRICASSRAGVRARPSLRG